MRFFLLLLCLSLVPGLTNARLAEGVTCVQDQLNKAGFDPGPSDGQAGPATRRALDSFEQQAGEISERELDTSLGNSFCRLIGNMRPDLKEFWPSNNGGAFQLAIGSAVNKEIRTRVRLSLNRAYDALNDIYQVDLAGRDVVVLSDNPKELEVLASKHLDVPVVSISAVVDDVCKSRQGVSGRVFPGLFLICVNQADAEISQVWLDFLIGHEVTHLAQFQLGGAVRRELGQEMNLRFHGPVWLYEGVAQAFGNRFATNAPDWDFRIVNYNRLDRQFPALSGLELRSALDTRSAEVYRAGTVGAIDLIDLYGYPSIAQFYENLGSGLPWKDAFSSAFGLSLETFYFHYQNVDRFDGTGKALSGPLSILAE